MGSPKSEPGRRDDENPHKVTLTQSFGMGVHEVTQAHYEQVVGHNPSEFPGATNPVEKVNWDDAVQFCRKLSALPAEQAAGREYRLPTSAEWEYAARAGTTTDYRFGDVESQLGDYAWFKDNSGNTTHTVRAKLPNAWGLYDMHGHVEEWCQDKDDEKGSFRVFRGGGWNNSVTGCRSASRSYDAPSNRRVGDLGFRVVLSPVDH